MAIVYRHIVLKVRYNIFLLVLLPLALFWDSSNYFLIHACGCTYCNDTSVSWNTRKRLLPRIHIGRRAKVPPLIHSLGMELPIILEERNDEFRLWKFVTSSHFNYVCLFYLGFRTLETRLRWSKGVEIVMIENQTSFSNLRTTVGKSIWRIKWVLIFSGTNHVTIELSFDSKIYRATEMRECIYFYINSLSIFAALIYSWRNRVMIFVASLHYILCLEPLTPSVILVYAYLRIEFYIA